VVLAEMMKISWAQMLSNEEVLTKIGEGRSMLQTV